MGTMNAIDFGNTHRCDTDWLILKSGTDVVVLAPGDRGTTSGFAATVIRHYHNGIYEVRVPGGVVCIEASDFDR